MSEKKQELKNCPFCGESENIGIRYICVIYGGYCYKCKSATGHTATRAEAIEKWNTRAENPQIAALEAELQREKLLAENVLGQNKTLRLEIEIDEEIIEELREENERLSAEVEKWKGWQGRKRYKIMKNKIKQFIKTDALAAVEADAETAIFLICDAIDFRLENYNSEIHTPDGNILWVFELIDEVVDDMNFIYEAEKAVIEKVGLEQYGASLDAILFDALCQVNEVESHAIIATASAHQRIAAMLSALAELD